MKLGSLFAGTLLFFSFVPVVACGSDSDGQGNAGSEDGGPTVCPNTPAPQKPQAACDVTIAAPPVTGAKHLPEGTPITYCSNPPSSGNHYPIWADFQEYTKPIDWPYLVHDMEHGAVVLLYKCDAPGCPDVVAQLRTVRDQAPADSLCAPGVKRIIIAPSPTIPTMIAAASWGKTYTAPCLDLPTLTAFVHDNYGKGTEPICAAGRTF